MALASRQNVSPYQRLTCTTAVQSGNLKSDAQMADLSSLSSWRNGPFYDAAQPNPNENRPMQSSDGNYIIIFGLSCLQLPNDR